MAGLNETDTRENYTSNFLEVCQDLDFRKQKYNHRINHISTISINPELDKYPNEMQEKLEAFLEKNPKIQYRIFKRRDFSKKQYIYAFENIYIRNLVWISVCFNLN